MADDPKPNTDPAPTEPGGRLDPKQLLAKEGDWESVARTLAYKVDEVEADNFKYRTRIRALEDAQPPPDALVISGDARKAFDAMKAQLEAAGIDDAAKLEALLSAKQQAEQKVEAFEHKQQLADVARIAGANLPALEAAKGSDALRYEVRGEGDDAEVFVIRERDEFDAEDPAPVPFEDYVNKSWPALADSILGGSAKQPTPQPQGGAPFIVQKPSGRPAPKGPDAAKIAERKRMSTEYAII